MIPSAELSPSLAEYGYVALFILSLVEGPMVTVAAGFLAAQGLLSLPGVFGVVILGDMVGDTAYYGIGRWFQIPLLRFLGRHRPKLCNQIEQVSSRLRSHPGRVLLFGKLTHATGFAVLLAAGAAGIRLRTLIIYCILGTLPKAAVLVATGYFFGESYKTFEGPLQRVGIIMFLFLVVIIAYVLHRWTPMADHQPEKD